LGKKDNFKERSPVPIKKVRVKKSLKTERVNMHIKQYVALGNNHHIIIYKNEKGEFKDDIISFWEVVGRLKDNQKVYQLPSEDRNGTIITTLQENDMFILDLTDDEFKDNINNNSFLTKHLYRVQKISKMNIMFRHHLASTQNKKEEQIHVQSLKKYENLNPKKVKITKLGKIQLL